MAVSDKLGMYLPTRDDYISVKRDISDNLAILDAAAGDMDIIINGNTSSKNVTSGQFVTVLNSTITGVTDGIYKAVANVAAGVPFVAANLTTTTSGALNELVDRIVLFRTKTSGSKTVSPDSYATWSSEYDGIAPDSISGYKVLSAFAITNHDRIELGVCKVSDTRWNVSAHNTHSAAQDCTVTICYVYIRNTQ